ncbi:hypothetical protein BJX64DRAFT_285987 [Aspergillus heterothallicus]
MTYSSADYFVTKPDPIDDDNYGWCEPLDYDEKSGDGCWAIATDHGITRQTFINWNPAVSADCIGLGPEYWYCVAI